MNRKKETDKLSKIWFFVFIFISVFIICHSLNAYAQTRLSSDMSNSLCNKLKTKPDIQISLFFGLYRPQGNKITEKEWRNFVDTEVTSRFPNGFSIISMDGQWKNRVTGHIGKEPSRLILISTEEMPGLSDKIENIRTFYRNKFQQQEVGLIISSGCESFYGVSSVKP